MNDQQIAAGGKLNPAVAGLLRARNAADRQVMAAIRDAAGQLLTRRG